MKYINLKNRGFISVSGEDAANFLQGIITNDINKLKQQKAIYALILSPQGKYLFDFFIINNSDNSYLIECNKSRRDELIKKLSLYKLRSKVVIQDVSEKFDLVVAPPEIKEITQIPNVIHSYNDPRNADMGQRIIIESNQAKLEFSADEEYEKLRIKLGIPEGDKDMEQDKSFPLQFSMEELNAIDFRKGCYVGQEVTARTKYRGIIRKKTYKIESKEEVPEYGTEIFYDNSPCGITLSHYDNTGLALIETEIAEKVRNQNLFLVAGEQKIRII